MSMADSKADFFDVQKSVHAPQCKYEYGPPEPAQIVGSSPVIRKILWEKSSMLDYVYEKDLHVRFLS